MTRSTVWTRLFGLLAMAGFIAWCVRPFQAYYLPLPRWDILGAIGLFVAGGLAWILSARLAPRARSKTDTDPTAPPGVPGRLPFIIRQRWSMFALAVACALTPLPAAVLTSPPEPEFARRIEAIKQAGPILGPVTVEKVRSVRSVGSKNRSYLSDLVVALPDREGGQRVEVKDAHTNYRLHTGDRVTAVYSPKDLSQGALIHYNVTGYLGGTSRFSLLMAGVWLLIYLGVAVWLLAVASRASGRAMRLAVRNGTHAARRVRATEAKVRRIPDRTARRRCTGPLSPSTLETDPYTCSLTATSMLGL